ncbi:glycosyltransferase [Roseiconus nitratireducens]|uniref:glycosyltransferase n=1 Tax=Roseiconus nitratireducens TaxID=2605748 RepID=UPI001375484E|nr:glycosyltransferase [Roseiconus nitratireducens]
MKIIQISAADFGGGVETVVRQHHRELSRQGHQTQLLVGRKKGGERNTTVIPLRTGPKGALRTARWIQRNTGLQNLYAPGFRAIEQSFAFEPDVLHFHSLHGADSYAELAVVRRLSRRYPTVVTLHDFWLMTGHCGYPLECPRWLTGCGKCPDLTRYPAIEHDATRWNFARKRKLFKNRDIQLVVPSAWLLNQARRSPILRDCPISVVTNPVDVDTFSPAVQNPDRARFGIGEDETAVMLIANHLNNPYKGMDDGIAALNRVSDTKIKVVIVGNSADEVSKRLKVPSVALPYTTSTTDLAEYYRVADLLLMPSRCETFGLVAAEAMACGTPVIAFDAGALPEVIGDRDTGVVVTSRDTSAMAAEIDALAADRQLRRTMSHAAAERIRRLFHVSGHTRGTADVYERCIQAHACRLLEPGRLDPAPAG